MTTLSIATERLERQREYQRKYHVEYAKKNKDKMREYQREYKEKNKEKVRERTRKYRAAHPDRVREQNKRSRQKNKEQRKSAAAKHREDNPLYFKFNHLKRKYGVSSIEFMAMMRVQGDRCAICGEAMVVVGAKGKKRAYIDHDHATGQVRALLCQLCNSAIGFFSEDPARMRRAAEYVEAHARIASCKSTCSI
jgi:hypothetical protein